MFCHFAILLTLPGRILWLFNGRRGNMRWFGVKINEKNREGKEVLPLCIKTSLPSRFFHEFLSSAIFFSFSVIPSECQIVWIEIRPDILAVLI